MPNINEALKYPFLISLLLLWALVWKGIALWQAANRKQISWFVLIMIFNTFGLLEIGYISYFHRYDLGSKTILKKLETFKLKK